MNRQCRICLDTDNPQSMIAPCQCRGTSQFIHGECFREYLHHYPDGMCRVCRKSMIFVYPYEIILFAWMMFLIVSASIPIHTKIIYILMAAPIFVSNKIHKIFTPFFVFGLLLVSIFFLTLNLKHIIQSILIFAIVGTLGTIMHYVPPQYILIISVIAIGGLYACFLVIYVATTTDGYMMSFFIIFVSLLWAVFIRMRPPFHAIN